MDQLSEHEFEMRLSGTQLPDGQIGLAQLAALADALQELMLRLGRFSVEQRGAGRTPSAIESLTRLRLTGLTEGSTRLAVSVGDPQVLELAIGPEQELDDLFWEVVAGIKVGQRPRWAPDLVADSAAKLVGALQQSAESVEIFAPHREPVRIVTAVARQDVWEAPRRFESDVTVVVEGRLEAVDLKSNRFRIRDDAGNSIGLWDVLEPHGAAKLVGERAAGEGIGVSDRHGVLIGISHARLRPSPIPDVWRPRPPGELQNIVASAPGPDPDGGVDLSDDEFDAFLAVMHG